MLYVYPAVFHKENDSYWVEFPDLEGCQSYGDSIPQVIELAGEALGLYISYRIENGLKINPASDISNISKPDDGFVSYIPSDALKYVKKNKAVKKTLTIPEWLNDEAEKRNLNFSGFLQKALIDFIQSNP